MLAQGLRDDRFDALEVIPTRLLFPSHDNEFHTSQIGFVERAAFTENPILEGADSKRPTSSVLIPVAIATATVT